MSLPIPGMTPTETASWTRRLAEANDTTEHAARATLDAWWRDEGSPDAAIFRGFPSAADVLRAQNSYIPERIAVALAYHVHTLRPIIRVALTCPRRAAPPPPTFFPSVSHPCPTLRTRYAGPTNTRSGRVIVTAPGGRRMTVPWDHALGIAENHAAAVDAFRREHRADREGERWILTSADDGAGYLAICLPPAVRP